jgi:DNA uptake protein ComE-like DNA-binding protein
MEKNNTLRATKCMGAFRLRFFFLLTLSLTFAGEGCNWARPDQDSPAAREDQQQRDEKTRDEVARETERLKPTIESAGRKLNEAAEKAIEEAHAAAQGAEEGWARGGHAPVDLNQATEKELLELPGISAPEARRIIRSRPYREKRELVTRGILPRSSYDKIQDQVTAN